MPRLDLSNPVLALIENRIAPSLCGFAWSGPSDAGNGSGTLVSVGGKVLIITCEHVASPFFACTGKRSLLVTTLFATAPVSSRLLYSDRSTDVAIVEVLGSVSGPTVPSALLDRAFLPTPAVLEGTDVAFCGLPYDFVAEDEGKRVFTPLVFLTSFSTSTTSDRYSCDYPLGRGEVSNIAALPEPHGISGSLLWTVPNPSRSANRIWTLEDMRAVGIITSFYRQSGRLEAVPLSLLPDRFLACA